MLRYVRCVSTMAISVLFLVRAYIFLPWLSMFYVHCVCSLATARLLLGAYAFVGPLYCFAAVCPSIVGGFTFK